MANVLQKKLLTLPISNQLYKFNRLKNIRFRSFFRNSTNYSRSYGPRIGWLALAGAVATGAGTVYCLTASKPFKIKTPFILRAASEDEKEVEVKTKLTLKQKKFDEYASYEYGGNRLMSPNDFLDSLIDYEDSSRVKKKILTTQDVDEILNSTQKLPKDKEDLFAYMGENGIITYPEYLFLLTLLTKSTNGLHVAFRMLDLDGNETLGKTEFEELAKMLNKTASAKSLQNKTSDGTSAALPNTSLLIYFFGVSGHGQLTFTDMLNFTRNLQREFWKSEFLQYSDSKNVMDGERFAKLLLQSTQLNDKDIKEYIERLKSRQATKINVSLQDYIKFGEFLNNLDEFSISLKIYNVANQPITQEEFKRAILISTGDVLADHIVNTVFQLFDIDGDGKLSQKEFLGLMKDRVQKRFATRNDAVGLWDGFIKCVKVELVN